MPVCSLAESNKSKFVAMREYLILIFLSLASTIFVYGQPGFLNIDCGKDEHYTGYSALGLLYTSDFDYINTGEIHRIRNKDFDARLKSKWLDVRSFPTGIRNCYTLKPVSQGRKYLLRAGFIYGDYDGNNTPPQFDLYLGIHYWTSYRIYNASGSFQAEAVFVTSSSSIQLCLVNTGLGTPFISAIDLRPLPDSIYPQVNSSLTLVLESRNDFGVPYDPTSMFILPVSYPIDPYDREWNPYGKPNWDVVNTTFTITTHSPYAVPSVVMVNAASPMNGLNMDFDWSFTTSAEYYLLLHFAELQVVNETNNRIIDIAINGEIYGSFSPKYLIPGNMYIPVSLQDTDRLAVSLSKAKGLTLPPILNALELYRIMNTTEHETNSDEVDAITTIKDAYMIPRNWMGDPCMPKRFVWDGLNCSYINQNGPMITALNLSSSGLNGEIPSSLVNLTQLEYLDLSWNGFTGVIPDILATLSHLKLLDLTGNKLHGLVPKVLLNKSSLGLLTLRVGSNPDLCYNSDSCQVGKKGKTKVVVIATISSVVAILLLVLAVFLALKRWNHESIIKIAQCGLDNQNDEGLQQTPSVHSKTKKITFAELQRITRNFHKEIGKGGFGTVYYGMLESDVKVAVKVLSHTSSQGSKEFQAEAQVLSRIHHRNLVSLVGYCNDENHLALLYEYVSEGNLHDHISGKRCNTYMLSWKGRLRIAVEAAQGLEYLHKFCKPAVVHRDVKTRNILLTEVFEAKIADLGLSKILKTDGLAHVSTAVAGTPGYLDPEYYTTNKLTEKSDVYSFGVVLLELLTGLPPVVEIQEQEHIQIAKWVQPFLETGEIKKIVDKRLKQDYDISSMWKMVEIAFACLSDTSIKRPTMTEVLLLLKECLELEMSLEKTNPSGDNSFGIATGQESFLTYPSAR